MCGKPAYYICIVLEYIVYTTARRRYNKYICIVKKLHEHIDFAVW